MAKDEIIIRFSELSGESQKQFRIFADANNSLTTLSYEALQPIHGDLLSVIARLPPEGLRIVPSRLRALPMLLRDFANEIEDYMKYLNIVPVEAWEPEKKI